ncbi:RNA polymerase sigma-70 factor [Sphingobacterium sp. UT-1RO-CII-1]|uniref:RNA polymerase sigma factor n=1 Tax=Sphingobacterium sp. UT-1RO-CII-1 TaxID=2995225 RepID=UPI00227B6F35|nr:RNA polymerase sigma-70 factor [Sphingobacterium sp. UT-1RO-CII-1]MCY4779378.1 RNA polymerase sigma-70 factor [Sphingobacterium sp. UT-1RO-CII-1]
MYNLTIDPNDEFKLLVAMQSGNQEAYGRIYQVYSAALYLNILKMVKNEADAQELLQVVFLKVWLKRHLIDPNQSFRPYLFQIAKYSVYNFFRKKNLDRQVDNYMREHQVDSYSHVEEHLHEKESEQWLMRTIEQLPERRQQIFKLCKIEGKSYAEVSEMLGISTSTINDHIVKATRFIKDRHQELGKLAIMLLIFLIFK